MKLVPKPIVPEVDLVEVEGVEAGPDMVVGDHDVHASLCIASNIPIRRGSRTEPLFCPVMMCEKAGLKPFSFQIPSKNYRNLIKIPIDLVVRLYEGLENSFKIRDSFAEAFL
jgi:hypothetical protein